MTDEQRGQHLERFKLGAFQYIDRKLAESFGGDRRIDISLHGHFSYDDIVLRVIQEVYGEHLGTLEVKWPATWWQHFKQDVFPAWLLRRFPVRYAVERHDARLLYPQVGKGPDGKLVWMRAATLRCVGDDDD